MNIFRNHVRRSIVAVMLFGCALVGAGKPATDELLRLVPADIAACVILEDVAEHAKQPLWERINRLPLVNRWKKSDSYRSFEALVTFLPVYFGISNEVLVNDVLGESVVLAFRPGEAGEGATGLFLCRASDEAVLTKLVDHIVTPNPNREVIRHSHRGVEFFERTEFQGRHDFVLRLGPVAVLSDKRKAILSVIEASTNPGGLYEQPLFQEMRASAGEGAVLQLLVNPRPFDRLLDQAVSNAQGPAAAFAGIIVHFWHYLDWLTLTVHVDDPVTVALSASIDAEKLPESERQWPALLTEPTEFWERVPESAVAAVASKVDFVSLSAGVRQLGQSIPELGNLLEACCQLAVGFDVERDIVPGLGPEIGAVATVNAAGNLDVLAEIELSPNREVGEVGLSLPETLELLTLRPLLVFYSLDHNMMWNDQTRTETLTRDGLRIHSMIHSSILPSSVSPSFAVTKDRLYLASSADAIVDWQSASTAPWSQSEMAKRFRSECGEKAVPKALVNAKRLRDFIASRKSTLASDVASKDVKAPDVEAKLDDLISLLELMDFCTLSTSTDKNVRTWRLSIFQSK